MECDLIAGNVYKFDIAYFELYPQASLTLAPLAHETLTRLCGQKTDGTKLSEIM